jgi:hypothetical protein
MGATREFFTDPAQAWLAANANSSFSRSRARYPDAGVVYGYLGPTDGDYALVPYESVATLATQLETYSETPPFYYVGPGVTWNSRDSRIYVRLEPGVQQPKFGLDVPANTDPRRVRLILFPDEPLLTVDASASNVVIDGLGFEFGGRAIEVSRGARDLTLRHCTFRCGRYSIVVRDDVDGLVVEDSRFLGHFPPYVAWTDVKLPEVGRPAHLLQGAALTFEGRTSNVTIRHTEFRGLFDAIDATEAPEHFAVVGCTFADVRDDVLQLGTAGHHVEFANNVLEHIYVGMSWNGSGAAPASQVGTKYFHHNVVDASRPQLHAREDPGGLLPSEWQGPANDGFAVGQPIGIHDSALATGPDPWKVYNNTFYCGADVDGGGSGGGLSPLDLESGHAARGLQQHLRAGRRPSHLVPASDLRRLAALRRQPVPPAGHGSRDAALRPGGFLLHIRGLRLARRFPRFAAVAEDVGALSTGMGGQRRRSRPTARAVPSACRGWTRVERWARPFGHGVAGTTATTYRGAVRP